MVGAGVLSCTAGADICCSAAFKVGRVAGVCNAEGAWSGAATAGLLSAARLARFAGAVDTSRTDGADICCSDAFSVERLAGVCATAGACTTASSSRAFAAALVVRIVGAKAAVCDAGADTCSSAAFRVECVPGVCAAAGASSEAAVMGLFPAARAERLAGADVAFCRDCSAGAGSISSPVVCL